MQTLPTVDDRPRETRTGRPVSITTETAITAYIIAVFVPAMPVAAAELVTFFLAHGHRQLLAWAACVFVVSGALSVFTTVRLVGVRKLGFDVAPTTITVRDRGGEQRFERDSARIDVQTTGRRSWITVTDGSQPPVRVIALMRRGRRPSKVMIRDAAGTLRRSTTTWNGEAASFRAIVDRAETLEVAPHKR